MRSKNRGMDVNVLLCLAFGIFFVSCQDSTSAYEEDVTKDAPVAIQSETKKGGETHSVFVSGKNVTTWDHINAPTVSDWPATVCTAEGSIGLDAGWVNPHKVYNTRPLYGSSGLHAFEVWYPHHNFDAVWINSMYARKSKDMNPNGDGHNWTKYEMPVSGNGRFVIQLLADNCSWVYLDGEIIAYQDDSGLEDPDSGQYGVTLNGDHILNFIIYDGGGDAGGKFRLETTSSFGGDVPSYNNTAPVANAGNDQTLEATGPTTPVSLDGSGSTDADGDELTYSWTLEGNEISTSATASASLAPDTYTFTLTVLDGEDSHSDDVSITVEDTTPPELSYNQTSDNLWPPNHKMVKVVKGIQATDLVDGSTDVTITVSSNESANGRGDGNTEEDYEIQVMADGSYTVYLRAERSGKGGGRVYTIDLSSSDDAGNTTSASLEVSVAKSQGRK